jgi:hypothetical protein
MEVLAHTGCSAMSGDNAIDSLEERALKFARGFEYIGGEVQLAMQAAGMRCYIEGYRDHEREQEAGIPCSSNEGELQRLRAMEGRAKAARALYPDGGCCAYDLDCILNGPTPEAREVKP